VLRPGNRISLGAAQFVFTGQKMEQQSDGSRTRITCRSLRVEAKDFNTGMPIRLLDDVSLVIDPCEFVGLLGPSGAGKSTLMDAMNGSRPAQQGHVLFNAADLYSEFASLRSMIGYVPQEDILHRQLTVKECLYYAARLQLPDDFGETDIWLRINETIKVLELADRADLAIAQLSGGQRKRVSLGIELLSKPAVLFVDEPTAGQDPRTEMKLMQLFREIANRGSTVIINTHLLGSFSLLDKVAVLVRGKLAYFGHSQEMLPYFKAGRPHEIFEKLQEKKPEEWVAQYRQSDTYQEFVDDSPRVTDGPPGRSGSARASKPAKRSVSRQLGTLLRRQFTLKFKEKSTLAALLLPPIAIEAHKYIDSPDLVDGLISVVREMRHKGTSVLVASQDPPSVPIALIELSSQIILHRFNSPAWLKHIQKANAALSGLSAEQMARLSTGEAYVWSSKSTDPAFSREAVRIQCRPRVTAHGGSTKTAV